MASRAAVVVTEDGELEELPVGDDLIGGTLPAATRIGEVLASVDGVSFSPRLPVTNRRGFIVTTRRGYIVVT